MELTVDVAESQEVARRGLAAMLQAVPGVTMRTYETVEELVVNAVENGWAGVSVVSVEALRSAGRETRQRLDRTPVLATLPNDEPLHVAMAAPLSAEGYVMLSELSQSSLEEALQDVANGQRHVPEQMSPFLQRWEQAGLNGGGRRLSPRENEVLGLLVEGLSNKEISRRLGISVHGTKRHVSNILSKLDSPSRSHLVSSVLRGSFRGSAGGNSARPEASG